MKKLNQIYSIILLSFLISATSCNMGGRETSEESEELLPEDIVEMRGDQAEMAGIQLGTIEYRALSNKLKVSGIVMVAPENMATICMPLGGFVQSTRLIPGDAVRKGETLAVLESQEFLDLQQAYLESRNKLAFAEADYNRHKELYKEDVYSQKNLEQVTSDYKSLVAQTRALEEKLRLAGIDPSGLNEENISRILLVKTPISGFLRSANLNVGKYVSPTDVIFEIVNNDHLMLELTLFEKDAAKVTEGREIGFYINNEAESHSAVVVQTGKAINDDKTYKVYAKVTEECENILPGMYVNAIIETSGKETASLPADAIVTFDDRDYIFIFEKNKEENGQPFTEYRMVEVSKGIADEGWIEVILPDEYKSFNGQVVVKGAYNLLAAKKNAGEMAC